MTTATVLEFEGRICLYEAITYTILFSRSPVTIALRTSLFAAMTLNNRPC